MRLFENRLTAAVELSRHLDYLRPDSPIVLGLDNGGVQVAEIVADALGAPLDVLLLARLRAPEPPHRVVGVVDEFGRVSMIESTARWHHLSSQQMIGPAREAFRDLRRKRGKVRAIIPSLEVENRTVIVVDEGVGTGARMLGAVASLRDRGAKRIVVAAPAGPNAATWQLQELAHDLVIPHRPAKFTDIQDFYQNYLEITDTLMLTILQKWVSKHPREQIGVQTLHMKLSSDDHQKMICCEVDLPPNTTRGSGPFPAVIFAHGFESDGRSPRSVPISQRLAKRNIIGVRPDLTGHGRSEGTLEDATDQQMLHDLALVYQQVANLHEVDAQRIGLYGSGSGGMLVLDYAAAHPEIGALVIRGPVCGGEVAAAAQVKAPTLLIHAERDTALQDSVEAIDRALGADHKLMRIPESSRLFNDPISLELMIEASVDWLVDHLVVGPRCQGPQRPEEDRRPSVG